MKDLSINFLIIYYFLSNQNILLKLNRIIYFNKALLNFKQHGSQHRYLQLQLEHFESQHSL